MQKLIRQCRSSLGLSTTLGKDTLTVLQYLQERNPFSSDPSLQSIATGVHKAVAIGDMILTSMNGITPAEYTFQIEFTGP